jgi:ATP-dependent exoDNAse (exonuclease V) alpha subunit
LVAETEDLTVVCTHRRDVAMYNDEAVLRRFGDGAISLGVHATDGGNTHLANDPAWQAFLAKKDFHEIPSVALGCRVMFTTNYYMAKGAANGTTGTVIGLLGAGSTPARTEQQLKFVVVRLDDEAETIIKVSRVKKDNSYPGGHGKMVKSTFPLTLAYASTAHKCQGVTIRNKCLLHVREAFCPGMLYVMLSRVTCRDNLFLARRLTPADFHPIPQTYLI